MTATKTTARNVKTTANKTASKAVKKPVVKKSPIVKVEDIKLDMKGLKASKSILDIKLDDSIKGLRFDSRFTKGWDSKLVSVSKLLTDIKTGENFKEVSSSTETRFLVHYVGLFNFYSDNGYKTITISDKVIKLDMFKDIEVKDYPKGLLQWSLLDESKKLAESKNFFKFQHLVRLHIVLLKLGSTLEK